VLTSLRELVPMERGYAERLFDAFRRLANNLILGSFATALLQGVVATIGYAIFGLDRVFILGLLTAMVALLPLAGSPMVWFPA
jgi:predicted PurR-regulated permease PerM